MPIVLDQKLEDKILAGARSSDTAAVAYAMLRLGDALRELGDNHASLLEALERIAGEIKEGNRRIARAIRKEDDEPV